MVDFTTRVEQPLDDGHVLITVTPPTWSGFKCGASVVLSPDQYRRYQSWLIGRGGMIQDALWDLSNDDREILLSGINPVDFNKSFADD